jgi:hypothetical protein
VALVVALISTAGIVLASAMKRSPDSESPRPATFQEQAEVWEKIRACRKAHGMQNTRERGKLSTAGDEEALLYRSCQWPAPHYASDDGYAEISVTEKYQAQYGANATRCNYVDVIQGCEAYTLSYRYARAGYYEEQEPFIAGAGQVLSAHNGEACGEMACCNGGPGPGLAEQPKAGEVFVMRNGHIEISDVRCQ